MYNFPIQNHNNTLGVQNPNYAQNGVFYNAIQPIAMPCYQQAPVVMPMTYNTQVTNPIVQNTVQQPIQMQPSIQVQQTQNTMSVAQNKTINTNNTLSQVNQKLLEPRQDSFVKNQTVSSNQITTDTSKIKTPINYDDKFIKSSEVKTDAAKADNKSKLNIKKLLIAGLAIGGIAAAAVLLHKKITADQAQKVIRTHIDFKEAATLEDAISYGKEMFGVKKYKGFAEADLDVVNWINEGLARVNNASMGDAHMPRVIKYVANGEKAAQTTEGMMYRWGTLEITKEGVQMQKKNLRDLLVALGDSAEHAQSYVDDLKYSKLRKTIDAIMKKLGKSEKFAESGAYYSQFSCIQHELGHLQHYKNADSKIIESTWESFAKIVQPGFNENGIKKASEMFRQVAHSVSKYGATSPAEFVAEVYAQLCDGKKFSSDVMKLYSALGGVVPGRI